MRFFKKSSYRKEDLKLLKILSVSKDYKAFIKKQRKNLGIPENGLLLSEKNLRLLENLTVRHIDKLDFSIHTFISHSSLSPNWYLTLKYLICFDIAYPPTSPIKLEYDPDGREVLIHINESVTQNRIKEEIGNRWEELKTLLKNLPEAQTTRQKNVDRKINIHNERVKKTKYKDIVNGALMDEYANTDGRGKVPDEKSARQEHSRFLEASSTMIQYPTKGFGRLIRDLISE